MGIFDIFRKNKSAEPAKDKNPDCTGDPDCPMCHLDEKTLETLKKSAKEGGEK